MRAFMKMTWMEIKLFLRDPSAAFFTLAFPLLLLIVFGSIFGNEPDASLGGKGIVDLSVPAYIGLIIGTIALMGLPVSLATYREKGILRRFRATPLRPIIVLGSQIIVNLIMLFIGIILLVVAGRLIYHMALPSNFFLLIAAAIIASAGFFALGFLFAAILPSSRSASAVGMAIFFPMLFLSGAALPREMFPPIIKSISNFLPLTHVVILLQNAWFGQSWNLVSVEVLVGMFIIGGMISIRAFRWE